MTAKFSFNISLTENGRKVPEFNLDRTLKVVSEFLKPDQLNYMFSMLYPAIVKILQEQGRRIFENLRFGDIAWAELGEDYKKKKAKDGFGDKGLMIRTGKLFSDLTGDALYKIMNNGIEIDTRILPEYWIYHQLGYKTRLSNVSITHETRQEGKSAIHKRTSNRKNKQAYVPRRPILGIEKQTREEIRKAIKGYVYLLTGRVFKGSTSIQGKDFSPNMYESVKFM